MKEKKLEITWQRLISDSKTCPRCGSTEKELEKAVKSLETSLAALDIQVKLKKEEISLSTFKKNPLESNRIWINGRALEEYLQGKTGESPCCDVCGPSDCRTITVEGSTYETVPSSLIVKAGLLATTELLNEDRKTCDCDSRIRNEKCC